VRFDPRVAQTPPSADTAASKQAAEETRIDFYKQHLRAQRQSSPRAGPYPCVDGYCAKQKYSTEVVASHPPPHQKLRGAAHCRFLYTGPHPQRRGRDARPTVRSTFTTSAVSTPAARCRQRPRAAVYGPCWARLAPAQSCVGSSSSIVKIPPSLVPSSWPRTALDLAGHTLVELYGARCQSEFLFRDSQQFTASPTVRHEPKRCWIALHCRAGDAQAGAGRELRARPSQLPPVFSMASWKQRKFNERFLDLFSGKVSSRPDVGKKSIQL